MRLGIEITSRCNARCAHCSAGCGPDRNAELDTATLRKLMDDAAAIDDGPLEFALTGGEPFLDRAQLQILIAHGHSLGAIVSCVTNAFWATSSERADDILRPLAASGLRLLGVSASRFHRAFVPADRITIAIAAAQRLGIRTVLKTALTKVDLSEPPDTDQECAAALADETEYFAVLGPGRAPDALAEDQLIRTETAPLELCPSRNPMVAADGRVLACCSSGAIGPLHVLGTIQDGGLQRAVTRLHEDPLHVRIRTAGPASLLPAVVRAGHANRLRSAYADACDLCTHLSSDPVLASAIRAAADTQR
ncbi:radical SAM protein [Nevskia ramosa]|uniref:radical SAM protein n=1 Tax=Nevskia ramosa TaxID=64002 RepID=UPI00235251BE|nr:radical SAM protein [Nevskia ramosa]